MHMDVLPIRRIDHETMSQRVYRDLRELIMSGQAQPGQRLTLKSLSEALGTSQMPVREALRQLAAEGALEFLANKSVRVPEMTRTKFQELLAIRKAVEGLAVERAAQIVTVAELEEMQLHHNIFKKEVLKKNPDPGIAIESNMRLHFAAYRAAQMPSLMVIIEGLWLQVGPVLNLDMRSGSLRLTQGPALQHHEALMQAMRAHDPIQARNALTGDLDEAADFILSLDRLK